MQERRAIQTLLQDVKKNKIATAEAQAESACEGSKLGGDKDPQPGQGGADPSVAGELHLNPQEEVPGLWDGPLQGHDAPVAVHLPHCEKALLVPAQDGEVEVIPRNDTGRAHAENVKGGLEAGGEREVVGSDSQGQLLALLPVGAGQALTTAARQGEEGEKKGRG